MADRTRVSRDDGGCIQVAARLDVNDARRLLCRFGSRSRLAVDAGVQALDHSTWKPDAMTVGSENARTVDSQLKYDSSVNWELATVAFLLLLVAGIAAPIALLIWQSVATTAAVRSSNAGSFVSASASQGGFFSPALTTVHTTEGSIVVQGAFSAPRGRALEVVELNKTGLNLCAEGDLDTCLPISGSWAGELTPTSRARSVFDFNRYGLNHDNLVRWLAAGVIFAFIALLGLLTSGSAADP